MYRFIFSALILFYINFSALAQQSPVTPFYNYLDLQPGQTLTYEYEETSRVHLEKSQFEIKVLTKTPDSLYLSVRFLFFQMAQLKDHSKTYEYNYKYPPLDSSRSVFDKSINREFYYTLSLKNGAVINSDDKERNGIMFPGEMLKSIFGMAYRNELVNGQFEDDYFKSRKVSTTNNDEDYDFYFEMEEEDSKIFQGVSNGFVYFNYDSARNVPTKGKQIMTFSPAWRQKIPDTLVTKFNLTGNPERNIIFNITKEHSEKDSLHVDSTIGRKCSNPCNVN